MSQITHIRDDIVFIAQIGCDATIAPRLWTECKSRFVGGERTGPMVKYRHFIITLTTVGLRSRPLMEWVLKVMANLLEPEEHGMAEKTYLAIERAVDLPGIRRFKA